MANIFDKMKGIFGKELTPGEQLKKDIEAEQKRINKINSRYASRRDQILECNLVMKDCRRVFEETILTEREIAKKKRLQGLPTNREQDRVEQAAIGIMVTDSALLDLESINSEADLNNAMNTMGKALKQLIRMDNSVANINHTSRNFIEVFFPGFKSLVESTENFDNVKNTTSTIKRGAESNALTSIYEIPQSVRARIDKIFVENIMMGDSYDIASMKATMADSLSGKKHTHTEVYVSEKKSSAVSKADAILAAAAQESEQDIEEESYRRTSQTH